jgi:hypothetical protein
MIEKSGEIAVMTLNRLEADEEEKIRSRKRCFMVNVRLESVVEIQNLVRK